VEQLDLGVSCEHIAEGLDQAAILMLRHISGVTALSLSASLALGALHREGPARVTTLATVAGISQPAMTELVQRMERQGLVMRVEDPIDGRAALITIADAGRALLDERRRNRHDRLAELLAALTPHDQATLMLAMYVALPMIRELIQNAQ
jgi:DNA-binding MarR family transcriptional regulator